MHLLMYHTLLTQFLLLQSACHAQAHLFSVSLVTAAAHPLITSPYSSSAQLSHQSVIVCASCHLAVTSIVLIVVAHQPVFLKKYVNLQFCLSSSCLVRIYGSNLSLLYVRKKILSLSFLFHQFLIVVYQHNLQQPAGALPKHPGVTSCRNVLIFLLK